MTYIQKRALLIENHPEYYSRSYGASKKRSLVASLSKNSFWGKEKFHPDQKT